ncbi:MAG: TRAP transporter large permease subunit, partial [Pyramidobacter sp.]|nr:TRAP transporter large permease subunit [Pyramidobacter sp.]
MGLLLGLSFLILVFLGMPIGLSIGVSSLVFLFAADLPFEMLPQMMFTGSSSFVLVAVPYFILAGDILAKGGISERIVAFAESSVGRLRGGLSIVSVIASMFIAAVSGFGAATTAAVGSALLPQLEKKGYDIDFSAALIAAAGTIGVVIPPSVPMVLFATIAGESVAKLFMAGFVPGVLMGGALIVIALWVAHKRGYPAADAVDKTEKRRRL